MVVCLLLLLMLGVKMNVVGCEVLKCFATGVTGERALRESFVVGF